MVIRPQDFDYFLKDIGAAAGLSDTDLKRVASITFDDPGRKGEIAPNEKPLEDREPLTYTLLPSQKADGSEVRVGRKRVKITMKDADGKTVWASAKGK